MANGQYRFYVERLKEYSSQNFRINQYPAFVLKEDNWDDYAVCSLFYLYYYQDSSMFVEIGRVKIIVREEVPSDNWGNPTRTASFLSNPFTSLDDVGGCSLGQDDQYYAHLRSHFGQDGALRILRALRDCALFPDVYDEMYYNPCFKGLIRFDEAEQMLRSADLIVHGLTTSDKNRFEYNFYTPYNSDELLRINFDFNQESKYIPRRLYAIIGENGTGKTYLLNKLPCDYFAGDNARFGDHLPRFSKIIKVSTSFYDDYEDPQESETSKFVYCGFRNHDKDKDKKLLDIMQERIIKALHKIKEKSLADGENKLFSLLKRFLPMTYLNEMYDDFTGFNEKKMIPIIGQMSSGECNMLFMICDILANIRYDTLILFDEPEVHMHPNAITIFMNIIYSILEQYDSYAIITTHSPLIVREILGDNVYVMERNNDIPVIRKIGMESFAANLTDLYNEVFSNHDTKHYYENVMQKLKRDNLSYEEVIRQFHSGTLDPNLNMRLMIMNMFSTNSNEED